MLVLACLLGLPAPAAGYFEGPPWQAASAAACSECHFGAATVLDSEALAIEGLPDRVAPGERYRLVVRLAGPEMAIAGFLLGAWQNGAPSGEFRALDARAEARGALARSTARGTTLNAPGLNAPGLNAPGLNAPGLNAPGLRAPGEAEWALEWQAPDSAKGEVRFELWANAADDDRSPLGDVIHRRTWRVPAEESLAHDLLP